MNAADYRPAYDDTVREFLPNDPQGRDSVTVARPYCLTLPSALILASLFTPAPKVVLAPPIIQAIGSPYGFSKNVPWLRFETGGDGSPTFRNAGVIASYWGMAGVPYQDAMKWALIDVATPVEGQ
jgi:hypothetical protein